MSLIIVDVESAGPIPAEFSMVCFGAVLFDDQLDKPFYGRARPISDRFVPEALAVSGFSREQHLSFDDPKTVMESFAAWLEQHAQGRAVFVSDNMAFDWRFINYYFHRFLGWDLLDFRSQDRRSLCRPGQRCVHGDGAEKASRHQTHAQPRGRRPREC